MTLFEAYNLLRDPHAEKSERDEGITLVYETLMQKAKGLSSDESSQQELASIAVLKLLESGSTFVASNDPQVHTYLRRTLLSVRNDLSRRRQEQQLPVTEEGEEIDIDETIFQSSQDPILDLHTREAMEDSELLSGTDEENVQKELFQYAREEIVPCFRGRAVANGRDALDEMFRLSEETATFDELVQERATARDETLKKARQNMWKNHERTRERILEWLQGDKCSLGELDVKLIAALVSSLRSRAERKS